MYSDRLRLSFVVYFLSFCVVVRYEVQSECVSLQLSGSKYHLNTDGLYFLDGHNFCNSHRIWIQESGEHYLYYVLDGYDGWTIGPWSCHWGDFLVSVKTTTEEPYLVSETWKEFSDEVSVWRNNSDLHIRCFDEVKYNSESIKCDTVPCQNGGSCIENDISSACSCQRGYYGLFCETAIDTNHCRSSPCMNGASCSDLINDFQCRCAPGFSGRQCNIATNVIDCDEWPCHVECAGKEGVTCYSHTSELLLIVGIIGITMGLSLLIIFTVRHIYLKHCYPEKDAVSVAGDYSWKDLSYKRLESLDSAWSLDDRVGAWRHKDRLRNGAIQLRCRCLHALPTWCINQEILLNLFS